MLNTDDDAAARKARARRLREVIERLKSTRTDGEGAPLSPTESAAIPLPESPRDFIQRKMRELDPHEPS
jgi:hypothetical protein